jgi:adenylate cyclase class 2
MGSNRNQEVEIKLRVTHVSAIRRRLKQIRARIVSPRTYEYNTLYDTPKGGLARRGQLIRIRIERAPSASGRNARLRATKAILTYKGPSQPAGSSRRTIDKPSGKGRYKVREEVEVAISDGEQMRRILSALGLRPLFRYEKFRTTYTLPGIRKLKIDLDETPIGTFLELEGAPSDIDRVAKRLGYSRSDYVTPTYGALYIADSLRLGRKPTDMLFRATKKLR